MADYDYSDGSYEKFKQQAQQQKEPSSDEIEMSLPSHSRRAAVPPRRFPSQVTPVVEVTPELQGPDPVQPETPQPELPSEHDPEAQGPVEPEVETDRDAEVEHEELHPEEPEHLEHSIRDTSTSTSTSSTSGSSTSTAGASAPEAHPQRDEPDDGEHTESTATPVEELQPAEQEPEPESVPDPVIPEPLLDPPSLTEPVDLVTASASRVNPPKDGKKPWLDTPGSHPASYDDKVFFSHEGETMIMKKISRPMIDQLRIKVSTITGGEFADKISGAALLTAFTAVKLGFPMDADENTAKAMRAFEMMEPRLEAIEAHNAEISRDIVMMADQMTKMNKKMGAMERSTRAIEMVQAFSFTDRVLGGVEGADDTAESIRLNAPAVRHTKMLLRKEADDVMKQEQERDARGISRAQGS